MIRVLLAEDQAMVRGALATLLGLEDDIEVIARFRDPAGNVLGLYQERTLAPEGS